jgi:hypothetical protein
MPCGSKRRKLAGQSRKAAMMCCGEQAQMVACDPFEAGIGGMPLKGKLRLDQPAAQGFGINGKPPATVGQSNDGHGATPFVLLVTRTTNGKRVSWEVSSEISWEC